MNATIHERKFSFHIEYDITTPTAVYVAQKALLSMLASLEVRTHTGQVAATIHGNFSLTADYTIDLIPGGQYHYACEKFFKGVYSCTGRDGTYHLFKHRGLKYSIFLEQTQVAAITRNRMIVGDGKEYDVRMNSNANALLIACMIVALNTDDGDREDSSVTYDFGFLGPEDRNFDENWQPS